MRCPDREEIGEDDLPPDDFELLYVNDRFIALFRYMEIHVWCFEERDVSAS